MIARVLRRLTVVWVVLVFEWAALLKLNQPGVIAQSGWAAVALQLLRSLPQARGCEPEFRAVSRNSPSSASLH